MAHDWIRPADVLDARGGPFAENDVVWTHAEPHLTRALSADSDFDSVQSWYQQSRAVDERFKILRQHRYYAGHETPAPQLGPVENKLKTYLESDSTTLLALLGGMGTGKSSTLQYLMRVVFAKNGRSFAVLNFDKLVKAFLSDSESVTEDSVLLHISNALGSFVNARLSPDDEMGSGWNWALNADVAENLSVAAHTPAADELRRTLGNRWRQDGPQEIEARRAAHRRLEAAGVEAWLGYRLMLLDFMLASARLHRRTFCIIFDNFDPLPDQYQQSILRIACRISELIDCKVICALRPYTYASKLQSAYTIVDVVEHVGPSVVNLVTGRVDRLSAMIPASFRLPADLGIRLRAHMSHGHGVSDVEIVAKWAREKARVATREFPLSFLVGVTGLSLRSALVLLQKYMRTRMCDEAALVGGPGPRIGPSDVVRSLLLDQRAFFEERPLRILTNVLDCGIPGEFGNSLCQVRLLDRIASARDKRRSLGTIRSYLEGFGYDEPIMLAAINRTLAQHKRLIWCDSLVEVKLFHGCEKAYLAISPAGEYYCRRAIFELRYLQEMQYACHVPDGAFSNHDPIWFEERVRSLELFLGSLFDQDVAEVQNCLAKGTVDEYLRSPENVELVTIRIAKAVAPMIATIAEDIRRQTGTSRERAVALQAIQEDWSATVDAFEYKARSLSDVLQRRLRKLRAREDA